MSGLNTYKSLRGLILSAVELKYLTGLPDAFIEDYLSILNSIAAITTAIDNIKHSDLSEILQSDPSSSDEEPGKHITNLQANTWEASANSTSNAFAMVSMQSNKNERGDTQALNWMA